MNSSYPCYTTLGRSRKDVDDLNGKSISLPLGMMYKRYHCVKCGTKLRKERTHRVVTEDDKDYYRYQDHEKFPRRDYDVYGYQFMCPSCGARIAYDEQCIIARIQKKQGFRVLSPAEIKGHYREAKQAHHKWVLTKSILYTLGIVPVMFLLFFLFAEQNLKENPGVPVFLGLIAVSAIVSAIRTHKGNYRLRRKFTYSHEHEALLQKLHACSSHNRQQIASAGKCYCFYCESVFSPGEITNFADNGQTALCPACGVDAIVPDSADEAIDEKLITEMNRYWF